MLDSHCAAEIIGGGVQSVSEVAVKVNERRSRANGILRSTQCTRVNGEACQEQTESKNRCRRIHGYLAVGIIKGDRPGRMQTAAVTRLQVISVSIPPASPFIIYRSSEQRYETQCIVSFIVCIFALLIPQTRPSDTAFLRRSLMSKQEHALRKSYTK